MLERLQRHVGSVPVSPEFWIWMYERFVSSQRAVGIDPVSLLLFK
eukprot:gnl/Chilomastix_caulleri/6394.p1 GENE.gnl/Chilomastix_caulleri/6394~~gnl/Chilomastix_caulleri/6394.p1  ORF type:complete len:52 (-),score=10.45 gnl/Chilomastix_caulleri/6394:113-247(-)